MLNELKLFEMKVIHWIGIVMGMIVAIYALAVYTGQNIMYFLIVISLVIIALPFMITFLGDQKKQHEKDEMFLSFSRDLVENVRSGTPIGKSIINLRNRNYGALTSHVVKLANQLSMGITLNEALMNFSREVQSKSVSRAVGLIAQAERAGGKIETILESVAISINQIETLKKERKAAVSNLVTQGYIIFMVFIVIMLVMEFKILPLVTGLTSPEGPNAPKVNQMNAEEFSRPLLLMLLSQSFFAGLVIGKISEGTIKAGIKHSFILIVITSLISTGTRVLFGGTEEVVLELFLSIVSR